MSNVIEESRLKYEYFRYGKKGMNNPKEFPHEKQTEWEDRI